MQYLKPALNIAQQVALLQQRGLIIQDQSFAEHFLSMVSYYRLEGYWWPFQSDKVNHIFKPNSRFEDVIALYNFDRELRLIVFDMIERIEIALRTQLIYRLSLTHTPWWFEDSSLFNNLQYWQDSKTEIEKEVNRSKEIFIQEHKNKYTSDSRCPPAWKSIELISFGALSKIYSNLNGNIVIEKDQIAFEFGTANHTYLNSWLHTITIVRNICAHHSRLWNRRLTNSPKLLPRPPLPWLSFNPNANNRKSIFVATSCMKYLLQTISPNNHFTQRFEALFTKYPNVDLAALGFPNDWNTQPVWQT